MEALSDDEVAGQGGDGTDEPARHRSKNGESKASKARAGGGKRFKKFDPPLPLEFKKLEDGTYQRFKLDSEKRAYQRHQFDYSNANKDGAAQTARPAPPTLFADTFLFCKAKSLITQACDVDDEFDSPWHKLTQRLQARVVRLSFAYFVRCQNTT